MHFSLFLHVREMKQCTATYIDCLCCNYNAEIHEGQDGKALENKIIANYFLRTQIA